MKLILKDGTEFEGTSFGAKSDVAGEVVFNTGMVGYVESFTDPSYAGQILVCTYPLVGNYGVPSFAKASEGKPTTAPFESEKIQIAGLVVSEYSKEYSHYTAERSLGEWLRASGVPAIAGVDTRALTKRLRERGVTLGRLTNVRDTISDMRFADPNKENLVARVSVTDKKVYGDSGPNIVLIDCGAKENIVRSLVARGARVTRVPWNYDFTQDPYDGVLISNGPGDPTKCGATVANIKKAFTHGGPVLGICFGNQLLALAAGAKTYKLKYGHRSQNQPCIELEGGRSFDSPQGKCYITSQNHGYAVRGKSLPTGWQEWFVNANDGSNEGIRHKTKPWRSVQFHPEASPGPTDTAWVFDDFISQVVAHGELRKSSVFTKF